MGKCQAGWESGESCRMTIAGYSQLAAVACLARGRAGPQGFSQRRDRSTDGDAPANFLEPPQSEVRGIPRLRTGDVPAALTSPTGRGVLRRGSPGGVRVVSKGPGANPGPSPFATICLQIVVFLWRARQDSNLRPSDSYLGTDVAGRCLRVQIPLT